MKVNKFWYDIPQQYAVLRQNWIESERGWGERPDGYTLHSTEEALTEFIKEYWRLMPDKTPETYSRPNGEPKWVPVNEDTFYEVVLAGKGIWK